MNQKKLLLIISWLLQMNTIIAQTLPARAANVWGISYYGDLLLHPGLSIDYQIPLSIPRLREGKNRNIQHQFNFRPTISYYHLPHYSNDFLFNPNVDWQVKWINNATQRYFFITPSMQLGYLRRMYIGKIYATTTSGFAEANLSGWNALTYGGGIHLGGSIQPNRTDWLLGLEYFSETSKNHANIHHIAIKIGSRFSLTRK